MAPSRALWELWSRNRSDFRSFEETPTARQCTFVCLDAPAVQVWTFQRWKLWCSCSLRLLLFRVLVRAVLSRWRCMFWSQPWKNSLQVEKLDSEQEAMVDWAVLQLQGSEGKCQRTRLGVKDFSTQVKTGNFGVQRFYWVCFSERTFPNCCLSNCLTILFRCGLVMKLTSDWVYHPNYINIQAFTIRLSRGSWFLTEKLSFCYLGNRS